MTSLKSHTIATSVARIGAESIGKLMPAVFKRRLTRIESAYMLAIVREAAFRYKEISLSADDSWLCADN
jgi:hypothetical protein